MRPDVPIVMITAYGDAETKRRALENGTLKVGRIERAGDVRRT
jgi:CheY-like chemotaxis protein